MVTNGDKGGRGSKIGIFTVTYFLNGPIGVYDIYVMVFSFDSSTISKVG